MSITARQVVALVEEHYGVRTPTDTIDRYLAGDPDQAVHGVATAMMATLDVLRQAAARGLDLVISHEPLFFHHSEGWNPMLEAAADPVYAAKAAFIAEHHLVVRRLHDGMHLASPDEVTVGTARALGWLDRERPDDPGVYDMPTTTLSDLAAAIAAGVGASALRYVGDPALPVSVVGLQPGFWGFETNRRTLSRPDVDVLVIGESNEWETGAYAADAVTAGLAKGLVVVGHVPSEEQGMVEVARWLPDVLPGLPVAFLPTEDPYRTVAAPTR